MANAIAANPGSIDTFISRSRPYWFNQMSSKVLKMSKRTSQAQQTSHELIRLTADIFEKYGARLYLLRNLRVDRDSTDLF